jgi:predicted dehydrogenase
MTLQAVTVDGARGIEAATCRKQELNGVAIVGLGYWGPKLARSLYQMQCAKRLVCCDLSLERLEHVRGLYSAIETTDELDDVMADPDIDAVIVATPVSTHFDIASRSLAAGKSTLVEKPLATSAQSARQLWTMARERGLTLMVAHSFEYNACQCSRCARSSRAASSATFFYVSSVRAHFGLFRRDVNVAWDLAAHDISIILLLLEQLPVEVSCHGQSHYRNNLEDVA